MFVSQINSLVVQKPKKKKKESRENLKITAQICIHQLNVAACMQ